MELQRIFTPEYANELDKEINPANYLGEKIIYDDSKVLRVRGIEKPEGLEEALLKAESDYEAAIILYESYPSLTPILASKPVLWLYLTHVDLARYVRKLWPDLERYDVGQNKGKERSEADKKKYIKNHWLMSSNGLMRTTIANLWWSVYLTVDEEAGDDHKYDLTKILFSNNGMRTRRFGTGHLGRNREALKGILTYIKNHPDIFESGLENRMIWITRHFNLIGGTKPLSNLKSTYFENELAKHEEHLRKIQKREDVTGPEAFV